MPADLDTILARALAKDLDSRHERAAALSAELRSIGAVLDVRSGEAAQSDLLPIDDAEGTQAKSWVIAVLAVIAVVASWGMLR